MPVAGSLPPGWEKKKDAGSGRSYYIDHNEGKTVWNLPDDYAWKMRLEGSSFLCLYGQVETACQRAGSSLDAVKELKMFGQELMELTSKYSMEMKALATKMVKPKRLRLCGDSLADGWQAVMDSLVDLSSQTGLVSKEIYQKLVTPGELMIRDYDLKLKAVSADYDRRLKDISQVQAAHRSAKQKRDAVGTAHGASLESLEDALKVAVDNLNTSNRNFRSAVDEILSELEEIDSNLATAAVSFLKEVGNAHFPYCGQAANCVKSMIEAAGKISIESDRKAFIERHRPSDGPPAEVEYSPFDSSVDVVTDSTEMKKQAAKQKLAAARKLGLGGLARIKDAAENAKFEAQAAKARRAAPGSPAASPPPEAFYCVSLEAICSRERSDMPSILPMLTTAVVSNGGKMCEGIFRVPASKPDVDKIKFLLDRGRPLKSDDPEAIAGALKLWLRELTGPVIPTSLFEAALEAVESEDRTKSILSVVEKLPSINRNVLDHIGEFLIDLSNPKTAAITKMPLDNLCMVFAPCLLSPPAGMIPSFDAVENQKTFLTSYFSHMALQQGATIDVNAAHPKPRTKPKKKPRMDNLKVTFSLQDPQVFVYMNEEPDEPAPWILSGTEDAYPPKENVLHNESASKSPAAPPWSTARGNRGRAVGRGISPPWAKPTSTFNEQSTSMSHQPSKSRGRGSPRAPARGPMRGGRRGRGMQGRALGRTGIAPSSTGRGVETSSTFVVPKLVEDCIAWLLAYGLESEGIFRIPASQTTLEKLHAEYEDGRRTNLDDVVDPLEVAGLLKYWTKHSVLPVVPRSCDEGLRNICEMQDTTEKITAMKLWLQEIPVENRNCLALVMGLLVEVAKKSTVNKMNASNLAMTYAPTLLARLPHGQASEIVSMWIAHFRELF